ncbi:hypothetical protein [Rhodohalobacter sulfatireducens]|uniref:DUF481 domain-containing protein n=1 Tax=Rhodohalobacter sulfatireducens TaxID=2911366 RepID=A0ABS9KFA6_9BACT|nr:hypothetical protein [Rhodohalobacter sulfatireducens]MCG2589539.1 hypothetical protein [Rhodohalobacter sulfatireducens]MDR9364904.1 hypothetical protein [Balneolaceae bacterium]MDR9409955.1 hypothetical protein [Balneolaceae bacterium]
MFRRITVIFFLLLLPQALLAQGNDSQNSIPNVYLDCGSCDFSYIRTNVTFVNYVRDQSDANIYILINDLGTAGGGREYTLVFSDINMEMNRSDTLKYVSPSTDSGDERRRGLTRYIKVGLVPFVSSTRAMETLDVFYEEPDEDETNGETVEDPWNNWVFDIDVRSNMWGESSEFNFGLYNGIEVERITPVWKIRSRARGEIRRRNVELTDRTINVNRDWGQYWTMVAYTINDHASIGLFNNLNFSRTRNIALNAELSPAFEYNFFPYTEYEERRFIIQYSLSPAYRKYFNTTIFLKDSEFVMNQELSTRLRYDQRWGRVDIRVGGANYFHDLSINRLEINPSFNVRIVRGLSVSISGRYRLINDQLSLELPSEVDPNDPISIIEGVQRPTAYDYSLSFGLSYTFGSIYNNVVNPRF